MLIRLIYVSKAVGPQTPESTQALLRRAHARNAAHAVTGVLCEGQGVYLQVLEGESRTVTALYARIHADPRHQDLALIHCESVAVRRYDGWSMAHVSLSDLDPQTKIDWPELDPYSPAGQEVMARIDELVAAGRMMEAPSATDAD